MTDKAQPNLTSEQLRAMLDYHQQGGGLDLMSGGMSFAPPKLPVAPPRDMTGNAAGDYLQSVGGHATIPSWMGGPAAPAAAMPVMPGAAGAVQSQAPDAPPLDQAAAAVPQDAGPMGDPLQMQLMDAYNKAQGAKDLANDGIRDAVDMMGKGVADETVGTQRSNDLDAAKAKEQQPIDQMAADTAAQNERQMAEITRQGEAAAKAQMIRVNAAATEAAETSVHNFWEDKTAGSRIMGVLAQALSGAANGLAGNPSAPTPLDRIIDQDIRKQIENMQNKRAAVGQEQSTMRLVYEQTGSRMAAQTAMTLAAYQKVKAMSQVLTDKYATPKAQAENQKIQGVLEQKAAMLSEKAQEMFSAQNSSQAMSILGKVTELANTDSINAGKAAGAAGKSESEPAPPGVTLLPGARIDKTVYAAVQKQTNGLVSFLSQSDKAQDLWNQPLTSENFQAFGTTMSLMLTDVRQFEGTGAALSPAEEANMQQMLVKYRQGIYPLPEELTAAKTAIARIQAAATRMYVGRIHGTGAPVDLNPNDPIMGHHIAAYMQEEAQIRGRRK